MEVGVIVCATRGLLHLLFSVWFGTKRILLHGLDVASHVVASGCQQLSCWNGWVSRFFISIATFLCLLSHFKANLGSSKCSTDIAPALYLVRDITPLCLKPSGVFILYRFHCLLLHCRVLWAYSRKCTLWDLLSQHRNIWNYVKVTY